MKPAEDRPESSPEHVSEDRKPDLETARAGHDSSVQDPRSAEPGLEAEFEDCIDLIDRVKQHSPECLVDRVPDISETHGHDRRDLPACDLPKEIGRFQIDALVGVGGFGLVYRAVDPDLDRTVALKIPRIETLLADRDRERFLLEAKMLSTLDHPNLATIYEAGHAGPICYMASAYYGGGSLAELLACDGVPPPRRAAQLVRVLAQAVQHAHSRGVLHRDIKPGNVLFDAPTTLAKDAEIAAADARITDFGLARLVDHDQNLTRTGTLIGTPAYMSPEQADSRHEDVSTASDIYSLGAVFYELLTGRPPHQKETMLATLEAVRSQEPNSPSRERPSTPRDLEAICLKCLEKSPQHRYTSAGELADDLRRWLDGEAVRARTLSTAERTVRWGRRHPARAALLASLVLGVTAIAGISTFSYFRVEEARSELADVNKELRESRDAETMRARQLRESLDAQISIVLEDLLSRQEKMTDEHRKYLQTALDSYERFAEQESDSLQAGVDVAGAYARVGDIRVRLGDTSAATAAYETSLKQLELLVAQHGKPAELVISMAHTQVKLAQLLKDLQRIPEAEALLRESLKETEPLDLESSSLLEYRQLRAAQLTGLGNVLKNSRRFSEAGEAFREAMKVQQSLVLAAPEDGMHRNRQARIVGNLAQVLLAERRPDEAEQLLSESKRDLEQLVEEYPDQDDHREMLARQINALAVVFARSGKMDRTEALFRELLRTRTDLAELFPSNMEYQQELAGAYGNLGIAMAQKGEAEEAAQLWRSGETVARRLVRLFPDVPLHHYQLGTLLLHLAQLSVDEKAAEQALEYAEEGKQELAAALETNPDNPMFQRAVAEEHQVMAEVMSLLGRHVEAAAAAELILEHPFHPARSPFEAAAVFAHCAALVQDAGDPEMTRHYQERALLSLKQAVDRGYADQESITRNEDFAAFLSPEQIHEVFTPDADD